jgi:hypothetical protein
LYDVIGAYAPKQGEIMFPSMGNAITVSAKCLAGLVALLAVTLLAPSSASAQLHTCGPQGNDNRPHHCFINTGGRLVHKTSTCAQLPGGGATYTSCRGVVVTSNDPRACCTTFRQCGTPAARYIVLCLGGSRTASMPVRLLQRVPKANLLQQGF